ncbi:trk system potassium uptake protein TrkA [Tissierella praeacuta DSM 18095]|uniref:Trk system potassium uptake protein TrkA n=1 Tax=Tissierella praeacuta DSM 18095 TaxID=1123404 RepID=A0A1M4TI17_9FIRM|nr:Trk system potassium transporter TrkA [Tissierella praeacuta]SHE44086.1 trk system potassium uptake protein TrkA [Tissierella praeacuta DSM 18095]SUP04615.1 Trk system potassium uptake protein trkA [Tissierella praeacuta]
MKVMVVGAGKLGYKLAESMVLEDIDVTVIDNNPKVINYVNEHLDVLTVLANGIDINILRELDINQYNLLVAATDSDETNTLICSLANKLGCEKTIARIRNPEYMQQLDFIKAEMGIDHIVNPDLATAQAMEKYLLKNYSFYSGEFASGKVRMIDFNIEHIEEFIGKKLAELENFDRLLITAISRDGDIIIPDGSTQLLSNDTIHVIGRSDDISNLNNRFSHDITKKDIERVMILGGSNIGFYLAQKLSGANISVTLIEKDKEKCQELSELLSDVLIIHGDGTDIHLLEEERISTMDAFVGVTGYDEENLLMALMAKQSGVPKTISKISRQNYTKIIDRLGIDAALNPIYITASNILKYIRGGKIVSVSLLIGGDGEVTEIIIGKDLPIVGKTLEELKLPKGIIIGAIVHNGKVVIPNGKSVIHANDRIVVFCLREDLPTLKMFFKSHKGGVLSELWNRAKCVR